MMRETDQRKNNVISKEKFVRRIVINKTRAVGPSDLPVEVIYDNIEVVPLHVNKETKRGI